MTKFSAFLGMALMMLLFVSCGDDAIFKGDSAKGKISLLLDINTSITASRAESSSTDSPTVHDLTIKITPQDGSHAPYVYGYDDFVKADANYPIGEYLLEVYCGDAEAEGFNAAHYYGSTTFAIKTDRTTEVAVTASMSKAMFTIKYSDDLKLYLSSYSAQLQSEGHNPVTCMSYETRPVYLIAGNVSIYIDIEKPSGAASRIKIADVNAEKAHHYKINVALNEDADATVGEGALVINFDEMLQQEDVTIDLGEDLINSAPPIVTCVGFTAGQAVDHLMGLAPSSPYQFQMTAGAGFGEVNLVTTNSDAICGGTWPASINLVGLDESQQQALQAMGLEVTGLWGAIPNQMAIVDLSGVVQSLKQPSDNSAVTFSLNIVDSRGKTNKIDETHPTPSLSVNVVKPIVGLSDASPLPSGQGTATFVLSYNGGDPSLLSFNTGESAVTPTFTSLGENKWTTTIDVDFTQNVSVTVNNGAKYSAQRVSSTLDIARCDANISNFIAVNEADVWAYKATLPKPEGISKPIFMKGLSNNCKRFETTPVSSNADYSANVVTVGNSDSIKHSTTFYILVADLDDHSKPGICYVFTTEEPAQLPNSGMESWYSDKRASGVEVTGTGTFWNTYTGSSNWDHWYPRNQSDEATWGWDTMNYLTTSQGGKTGGDTAYNTLSGTIPSNGHTGTNSALIRTVAWGVGNTAGGSTIKNVTAGQLYLGTYSDGPQYGMPFSSRPQSLSFYYKFSAAKSDDLGLARIRILDSNGNEIAKGELYPQSQSAWAQMTIDLTYPANAPKAAKIEVTFISSVHSTFSNSSEGLNFDSSGHVGAQLYIDDITLNY